MLTINTKKYEHKDTIEIKIFDKIYALPKIQNLPYKEVKQLIKLNEEKDFDIAVEAMSKYIPKEELEELTLDDLIKTFKYWNNNGKEEAEAAKAEDDGEENLGK